MCRVQVAAGSRVTLPAATARLRAWRRRERGVCSCRGVFCNPVRCSLPSSLGSWGELQLLRAFTSHFPTLLRGTEDWHQPQGRALFHHPVPHPPSLHLICLTV